MAGRAAGAGAGGAADGQFTSGPWFDGWREGVRVRGLEGEARPVAAARRWLWEVGWRRYGLLSVFDAPAAG